MANWYGIARTNYVKVKDYDALLKFVEGLPIEVEPHPTAPGFVSFSPEENDSGDFDYHFSDDDGNEECWDWPEIAGHFVEGQVLVVMTVGHEKARYLTGYTSAIAWDGRVVNISIDDIYAKIEAELEVDPRTVATCTYQDLPEVMPEGGAR